MATAANLGPWGKGLVNLVPVEAVGPDGLVCAENVDIGPEGFATTRTVFTELSSADITNPVYSFAAVGGTLVEQRTGAIVLDKYYTKLNDDFVGVADNIIFNGPSFYQAADESDKDLVALPGGSMIEAWQGRLLVARGASLLFSEPLNFGAYDPLRNFVSFPQQLEWLAPLPGGVFVGTASKVYFLAGSDPADWTLRTVDRESSAGGTISTAFIKSVSDRDARGVAACWFTSRGFVLGVGDGMVISPHEDRLRGLPVERGRLVQFNDRLWVLPR